MKSHIRREIIGQALNTGGRDSTSEGLGCSVARATAAKVSMIRFSHNSCTAVRGCSLSGEATEPMNVSSTPTMFATSWNCRNLRTFSFTPRPHTTARTMVAKLSSIRIIALAPLATSVPEFIAKPTLASFSAGASLVPSPVTPTTSPRLMRSPTSTCLSVGLLRASTRRLGSRRIRASGSVSNCFRKSTPSIASWAGSVPRMPHFPAIAVAVARLSPVTIRTTIPARRQTSIAPGTSSRIGSWIPSTAMKTSVLHAGSSAGNSVIVGSSVKAIARVRLPWFAIARITAWIWARRSGVSGTASPEASSTRSQSSSTSSDAPLTWMVIPGFFGLCTTVVIRFFAEEKG
eukprot:RCo007179